VVTITQFRVTNLVERYTVALLIVVVTRCDHDKWMRHLMVSCVLLADVNISFFGGGRNSRIPLTQLYCINYIEHWLLSYIELFFCLY
jgi:hypothetical protein